jgi:predicted GNAT superfamily acetyltransferase
MTGLDRGRLLALNNRHAVELSELSAEAFEDRVARACFARGYVEPAAFLLAYDETAGEGLGPNYAWFKARYPRFVYIDRVVVDGAGRGLGIASRLYADLFAAARAGGHVVVGCEVNSDPPNPASDAFHARHGFAEVGLAHLADRRKTVRYLARFLIET